MSANLPMPVLLPEEQLILMAMKMNASDAEMSRFGDIIGRVRDWGMVCRLAVQRGVGPLLLKKLETSANSNLVPADALNILRQSYFITIQRSMLLYEAFKALAARFHERGLKFVVLKGTYLSEMLYRDPGLRQFSDIDILVEQDRGHDFLDILREAGFSSREKELLHSDFVKQYLDFVHYAPMDKGGISVEVHVKLHLKKCPYKLDIPAILHDAVPVRIQNMPAHALQFNDLLIHVCIHADKHFNEGQIQFTCYNDIVNLLSEFQQQINWQDFTGRCKQHQCEKVVFRHILLARLFCNAPVPEDVASAYESSLTAADCALFVRFLRGEFFNGKEKKSLFGSFLELLGNIDGLPKKIRFLFHMLFPPKSYMVERYHIKNPANYRAYYGVRIWDGLKSISKSHYNNARKFSS